MAAKLTKTTVGVYTARGGAYSVVLKGVRVGGEVDAVYEITTSRWSGRVRRARVDTLAEAAEAVSAWERSRGSSWY